MSTTPQPKAPVSPTPLGKGPAPAKMSEEEGWASIMAERGQSDEDESVESLIAQAQAASRSAAAPEVDEEEHPADDPQDAAEGSDHASPEREAWVQALKRVKLPEATIEGLDAGTLEALGRSLAAFHSDNDRGFTQLKNKLREVETGRETKGERAEAAPAAEPASVAGVVAPLLAIFDELAVPKEQAEAALGSLVTHITGLVESRTDGLRDLVVRRELDAARKALIGEFPDLAKDDVAKRVHQRLAVQDRTGAYSDYVQLMRDSAILEGLARATDSKQGNDPRKGTAQQSTKTKAAAKPPTKDQLEEAIFKLIRAGKTAEAEALRNANAAAFRGDKSQPFYFVKK